MALRPVSDPDLLKQLSDAGVPAGLKLVDDAELLAELNSKPVHDDGFLRKVALTGRAAAEGVVGGLAALPNIRAATGNLMAKGVNKLFGTNIPMEETFSGRFSQALTDAGAYEPETPGEHYATAGIRGVTGALTGGAGLGQIGSIPTALRVGSAGASSGLASEAARQQGLGPGWQLAAGVVGGMIPGNIEELTRLGVRTAGNVIRPMTRSGQEQIASNIMSERATSPQAAVQNLDNAAPVIPGSMRTTGEASKDVGLLSLEKAVRGKNPTPFGQRLSEQNVARQSELSRVAGTEADIEAAKLARDLTTTPMRENALNAANQTTTQYQNLATTIEDRFLSKASALQDKGRFDTTQSQMQAVADKPYLAVSGLPRVSGRYSPHVDRAAEAVSASDDMVPIIAQRQAELRSAQDELATLQASGASPLEVARVTDRIDRILSTPGMRASQVVQKSMTSIRERLAGMADDNGNINAHDLYTVRKELGNYIQSAAKDSSSWDKRLTSGLQIELQRSIDDAIEQSAPGFKAYIERYKDMSKPIDQMKVIQEIQRRSQLSSADITTGQEFLGAGKFDSALKQALQKNGSKLTADQVDTLKAIRTDLQYGQAINSPLIKAPGSDTFQNLSIAQVIGAAPTNVHPALRALAKPLDWMYKIGGTDEAVNQILVDAMLDPKLASTLLQRATPTNVQKFSDALRVRTIQSSTGVAGGLSSTQSQPSENTNKKRESR